MGKKNLKSRIKKIKNRIVVEDANENKSLSKVLKFISNAQKELKGYKFIEEQLMNQSNIRKLVDTKYNFSLKDVHLLYNIANMHKILEDDIDCTAEELLKLPEENQIIYFYKRGWIFKIDTHIFLEYIFAKDKNAILTEYTISQYIVEYIKYNNIDILEIIKEWTSKAFASRKNAFRECIYNIKRNKYTIAISMLYVQLSGILYNRYGYKIENWSISSKLKEHKWYEIMECILFEDLYDILDKSIFSNNRCEYYKISNRYKNIMLGYIESNQYEVELVRIIMLLDCINDLSEDKEQLLLKEGIEENRID